MEVLENFFVIEGVNGSGKTSTLHSVADTLYNFLCTNDMDDEFENGYTIEVLADGTYTTFAKEIFDIIQRGNISNRTMEFLFSAARQDIKESIKKNKLRKTIYLCDRWVYSQLVYQSDVNQGKIYGRESAMIAYISTRDMFPAKTFFLNPSLELVIENRRNRNENKKDLFEQMNIEEEIKQYQLLMFQRPEVQVIPIEDKAEYMDISYEIASDIFDLL